MTYFSGLFTSWLAMTWQNQALNLPSRKAVDRNAGRKGTEYLELCWRAVKTAKVFGKRER